jgi:hypothetical protein
MSLFERRDDPLARELRQIERKRRELDKESRRLIQSSGLPPEPPPMAKEHPRGAILIDPDAGLVTDTPNFRTLTAVELRHLQRRQRNRFLIIAGLILVLLLMVFRALT